MSLRPVQIRVRILYELLRLQIPIQIGLPILGAQNRGSGSTSRVCKSLCSNPGRILRIQIKNGHFWQDPN